MKNWSRPKAEAATATADDTTQVATGNTLAAEETPALTENGQTAVTELAAATDAPRRSTRSHAQPERRRLWVT